jgi:phosphatidylserine/phosphatidylglycerophosphate/cardiolipin synthase-like enzyme
MPLTNDYSPKPYIMRKGIHNDKFSVHAIAGSHVITLAFDAKKEAVAGLLGFAIHRTKFDKDGKDVSNGGDWMKGYKPFEEIIPKPLPKITYPTNEHPWQSFTWADYAVEPDNSYKYKVVPVFGKPGKLILGEELTIKVSPEPVKDSMHEIHFNRGAAASQAYAIRFDNLKPNDKSLTEKEKQERKDWLSRGLFEAVCAFVKQAKGKGWGLRAALYELDQLDVMNTFKEALGNKADVKIIYESRSGQTQTKDNQDTLKEAGFKVNDQKITFARKNTDGIPHNKFIVLLKDKKPVMVWTGSTNISEGGIFGHSNVGHCIKDKDLAGEYLKYWNMLKDDPAKDKLKEMVDAEWPTLSMDEIPRDKMSVVFSPRKGNKMLDAYADLLGSANLLGIITLPFNVDQRFADILEANSPAVRYVMLNSGKDQSDAAKRFNPDPDVIVAPGSKFEDQWGQWLNEIHSGLNGSNVLYIHTKYMILNPMGPDTLIVTGSANFSTNSTSSNDENMVIIPCSNKKGETRVQDIYLGEFFRLFDHWYFRYLHSIDKSSKAEQAKRRFLKKSSKEWVDPYYKAGTDRFRRRNLFSFGFA